MSLKAVLFDFNGVIINDERIHAKLIEELLIGENLRPKRDEFRQICLGRSDRACIRDLLTSRGRVVSESYLTQLIERKAKSYQQYLETTEPLPIYPGLAEFIAKLRDMQLVLGIVSGALRREIEIVLNRVNIAEHFAVIVAGDDLTTSKPEPDGYLLAVERLNLVYPALQLKAQECLAIEDTFVGIEAAKKAGMQVVGVSNSYPMHMLQRHANWVVDYLLDLELERVQQVYQRVVSQPNAE